MEEYSILNKICSPEDLKKLSDFDRKTLADELRAAILDTVSRTGGHLASNLGAVELSIAIHTVFESPTDKIIWDVSHQSYAHKLLTGRKDKFCELRQGGGISGFTRRDESEHDAFGAGHASTSISAALGFAKARDLRGSKEYVVAVIGDGSLNGGLALEGLNNAEQLKTQVIVILNDNKMSIAENVGAMSLHLARLRTSPIYRKVENRARETLERMPAGRTLARTAEGLSHGVIRLLGSDKGALFEELGFTYIGPIDGHKTDVLMDVFESAKNIKGPILIHVLTQKGKGYEFAENNSRKFHGIAGFDIHDGSVEKTAGNTTYTKVFSDTLCELAQKDERICAITAAMPDGTGLSKFAEQFPSRFFDVGIAEEHAVTFASGLAAAGMRPVVAIYSTFLQRSYDQIIHDVCLQNLPVTFAIDRAGLVGEDGPTHHGVYDISFLRHIPNIVIAAPKDTNELRNILATALNHEGPFAIRYPRGGGPSDYNQNDIELIPIGSAEKLRNGKDAIVITAGPSAYDALNAADILSKEGIEIEVINIRYVKPLDCEILRKALDSKKPIITVEDNSLVGGFGSAILEFANDNGYNTPICRLGIPDAFIEHNSPDVLKVKTGIDSQAIINCIKNTIKKVH